MSELETPAPEAAPTQEAAVAVADAPTAAPAAEAPAVDAPGPVPPAKAKARSVQVPVWVLVVLAVVVVGVGAFFVGRETAPASASGPKTLSEAVEQTAAGEMEVGDFDLRTLLQALSRNQDLDLGRLGDLILGGGGGR